MGWKINTSEKGQAIVILTVAMLVLLGFTALAIDGSMIYSDRRFAQAAADSASLAGGSAAGAVIDEAGFTYGTWPCQHSPSSTIPASLSNAVVAAVSEAQSRAASNTFTIDNNITDGNGVQLICGQETVNGKLDRFIDVHVMITSQTNTAFAQFIYDGVMQNTTEAVTRVHPRAPAMPGYAIIGMGNCVNGAASTPDSLAVDSLLFINGGGNDGGVITHHGGIFLNAPEPSGSGHCSIDPPNSHGSTGMLVNDGFTIDSVGNHQYAGESKVNPHPIQTGINGGSQIEDPLAGLPEPTCTSNGSIVGGRYQPGRYGGSGQPSLGAGDLDPGIYCITGSISEAGHGTLIGNNVVLYFINGGLSFRGNANMVISAPISNHCLGTEGDTSASCTYKGIAIFMGRNNTSTLDARGNGTFRINGLVYGLWGTVAIKGGGNSAPDWSVLGQVIAARVAGNGGTVMNVTYDENSTYLMPAYLDLHK